MKLLIVEDQAETVLGIETHADEKSWSKERCGFSDWKNKLSNYNPDIVVLDWMYDAEESERGEEVFGTIWNNEFRPVIIFSALAATLQITQITDGNPLVTVIPKGDEGPVIQKLDEWEHYVESIRTLKSEMNKALVNSLQAVEMFRAASFPGDDIFKHMLGKRTATYFGNTLEASNPPAWTEYIYPPMNDGLLVGDIVREMKEGISFSTSGEPNEYYVILTPSCDMANISGVDLPILLANCEEKSKFSNGEEYTPEELAGNEKSREKRENRLIKLLNQGHNFSYYPLPEIPGIMPFLSVNLKQLAFDAKQSEIAVSYSTFVAGSHTYCRVASLESPFREQLVWAHMMNSCRPGMPVRDMRSWASGVLTP